MQDYPAQIAARYGTSVRVADWDEIKAKYSGRITQFMDEIGLTTDQGALVLRNGQRLYSSSRGYYIDRHNGSRPGHFLAHDNIDNFQLSLGSWHVVAPAMLRLEEESSENLLYLSPGDPSTWTVSGESGSRHREIQSWNSKGYVITTADVTDAELTWDFINNFDVIRLHWSPYGDAFPVEWAEDLSLWVNNGGNLVMEAAIVNLLPLTQHFGVQSIEGQNGGLSGLSWHYHGAPLLIGPVSEPLAVGSVASESMDRVILAQAHSLSILAQHHGYPAVAVGEFGTGKVVLNFFYNWEQDATFPGNAYRANIWQADNLLFLDRIIDYVSK